MWMQSRHEVIVRICIAYVFIATGTYLLFDGMENATAEGQPFSYGIWEHLNFLAWSMPSLVAMTYLTIGSSFRFFSWLFTAFCCYWVYKTFESYRKGFAFSYWHQGDLVCTACDNIYSTLAAATVVFGLCVFIIVLIRWIHGKQPRGVPLSIGAFALALLLFFAFAVGIS